MTSQITKIPWLEAAVQPEKLVERALPDHVIMLMQILEPCSTREPRQPDDVTGQKQISRRKTTTSVF
jgi:hypothetical protein